MFIRVSICYSAVYAMALCPSVSLPVCQRRCSVETVEPMTRCYKIYATKVTCLILSTARFHYAYFLELFWRFSECVSIYHNALVTGREVNIPDVNISCMQTALNFHARCSCVTVSKHYNRRTQRDARIASEMTVTCCSLLASRFGPSASRRVWRTDYAVSVDSCTLTQWHIPPPARCRAYTLHSDNACCLCDSSDRRSEVEHLRRSTIIGTYPTVIIRWSKCSNRLGVCV